MSTRGHALDTETTRNLVAKLYDAYASGDGATVEALIHDDIDWAIYGPVEVFPFAGPRRGKAAVMETLGAIASRYELKRYHPEVILADGNRAASMSNVAFVQRATGRVLSFRNAHFIRVEGERIIEFRELLDSFDVTQQALGRWLRV